GEPPAEVAASFIAVWRRTLVATDFAVGCSLLAVTASTDGPLRDTAGALFGGWIDALDARLVATGVDAAAAASFATTLLAAIEGAVAIARAQRSLAPFDAVATRLTADAATLVRD
ncbi:MAG TPA: TetR/AcrR family transcriptional regulator, partial [Microbacterium ginsengisoli]|nr:TetR/AcrR family transcriptional regulator [Microbacterium ginsengisoli]